MGTEWTLQRKLTERWVAEPLRLRGERLFLVAWEVMTNWKINDAHVEWDKPSIDFLFLDENGCMVAAELKRTISSPREVWLALCQVTHRATVLAESFSWSELNHVRDACCREDGDRPPLGRPGGLANDYADFLGWTEDLERIGAGPVRRLVLAQQFGSSWEEICARFSHESADDIARELHASYKIESKGNREMKRFLKLPPGPGLLHGPVLHERVDGNV